MSKEFAKNHLFIRTMTDMDGSNFQWANYGLFDPELIVNNAVGIVCTYFEMKVKKGGVVGSPVVVCVL